jgi:hypothetical protein
VRSVLGVLAFTGLLIGACVLLEAQALTPSEALRDAGQSDVSKCIDLQRANWSVLNTSAFNMTPLGPSHYIWDTQYVVQNNTPDDATLKAWSELISPITESVQE